MQELSPEHDRFMAHYQEHKDKVFNYLMVRLSYNRPLAEDLFMDIVLKAYQHFDKFDPEKGSFKTWLFALAHNHLINYWRDSKKTVSLEALEDDGFVPATVEPDHQAANMIESEKIQKVMIYLKPSDREIISLRYLQDLSSKEIANILGKKDGAVRTSLSRALDRFSDIYQKVYSKK